MMRYHPQWFLLWACIGSLMLLSSCNPFAPELDSSLPQNLFGDPHTIEGFFQSFRSAYQFKDTTSYGQLLSPDFVFSYHNYDRGLDLQWGRDEEMTYTGKLMNSAEQLDLLWGNVIDSTGSDTVFNVTRSFSLDVTFNPSDVLHTDGRAVFLLRRKTKDDGWQAVLWRDESNF
ncbi:MAG TPA: hypothetical protein VFO76_02805 [Candidatus Kapabacteria bacterium]|nr:hypothetical protein [Candidatus Kapabacteria bacterium]